MQYEGGRRPPRALLPVSFLIALEWLISVGFNINSPFGSPGQLVKSACYVLGSAYFLYELGQLLFCVLEQQGTERLEGRGKLAQIYQRHPFWVSLSAIMLFWLPHLIIAYPGYVCIDAWAQMGMYYGVWSFTTHHPPVHTVFLGVFTQLGSKLGDVNIGLYLSIIVQAVTAASVLAYELSLMKKWASPRWLRIMTFSIIVLAPCYTNYVVLEIKDTLFSIWFLLFVLEIVCMLEEGIDYFIDRKHRLLLAISIMGTILFRNNGKYVLYPTVLILLVHFWSICRTKGKRAYVKPVIFLLAPILVANLLSMAVIEHYGIAKGSIREALSLPFQQTARYVKQYGNEVTEEEAEAINAVLDYDQLAEKYTVWISDPVKNLYRENATNRELLQYFKVWIKMFFKHPGVYFMATMHQNYYLLYPFFENSSNYSSTIPEGESEEIIYDLYGISEVEALQAPKNIISGLYRVLHSLPVIGLFSQQAFYCILMILLIVFAMYKKFWHLIIAVIPLVLSAVIVVLAPVIQGHMRYAFPIIYAMPVIMAYYV